MKVKEIMTTAVKHCRPEDSLTTAATIMWDSDCGAVPVTNANGKVMGMITDRDICIAAATRHRLASDISVQEVMSDSVYACLPNDNLKTALKVMQEKKVRRLAVINKTGGLEGILCLNDLVLRSEDARGVVVPEISYSAIMETLKVISQHRVLKAA